MVHRTCNVLEAKRRVDAADAVLETILEVAVERFQRPRALALEEGHETNDLAARRVGQAAQDVARHACAAPCPVRVALPRVLCVYREAAGGRSMLRAPERARNN